MYCMAWNSKTGSLYIELRRRTYNHYLYHCVLCSSSGATIKLSYVHVRKESVEFIYWPTQKIYVQSILFCCFWRIIVPFYYLWYEKGNIILFYCILKRQLECDTICRKLCENIIFLTERGKSDIKSLIRFLFADRHLWIYRIFIFIGKSNITKFYTKK